MTASALEAPVTFAIEDFLARERRKDLLRFTTAGSVDDGKSTSSGVCFTTPATSMRTRSNRSPRRRSTAPPGPSISRC